MHLKKRDLKQGPENNFIDIETLSIDRNLKLMKPNYLKYLDFEYSD